MTQLRLDYDEFVKHDTQIVVIGPEKSSAFKAYWEKNSLPFIGIPDEEHAILKNYGQQVDLFKLGRMPAQMLIDKKGMLRYVHYGHSMKDIPDNNEVLNSIDEE